MASPGPSPARWCTSNAARSPSGVRPTAAATELQAAGAGPRRPAAPEGQKVRNHVREATVSNVHGREALVGAWQLPSWENRAADGQVTYPMGTDGCFPSRSRAGVGPGSPLATCSVGPPRSRPGLWRALWPMRAVTAFIATALSTMWSCRCSPTGRERPAAVGRTQRGSADPQRQPAAVGGHPAGAPAGLGAGRPLPQGRLIGWPPQEAGNRKSVKSVSG
jgi:hypothetical protein